jgi:cytochrome P450
MALHSNAQKRAQEEIDKIVGRDRLPTFTDRPSLPYVEAVYREIMRWRTGAPLGFPHAAVNDDMYKGYYIPKGTNQFVYLASN